MNVHTKFKPFGLAALLAGLILLAACAEQQSIAVYVTPTPVPSATPDDPPTLIVHGEQDTTVPLQQSQRFYDQLKAAGVPTELILVKNAAHGLVPEGGELSPSIDEVNRRIADFFDRYLRLNR